MLSCVEILTEDRRGNTAKEQTREDYTDKEGDLRATESLEGTTVKGSVVLTTWQRATVANMKE